LTGCAVCNFEWLWTVTDKVRSYSYSPGRLAEEQFRQDSLKSAKRSLLRQDGAPSAKKQRPLKTACARDDEMARNEREIRKLVGGV
jgi:hypothetical protein